MSELTNRYESRGKPHRWAIAVCAVLLIAFAVVSWTAARTKSHAFDEPLHGFAAYNMRFHGDYTVNPEDPPLWQWWASLPLSRADAVADFKDASYQQGLGDEFYRWQWTASSFILKSPNDGETALHKEQAMLLLLGVLLGAVLAWWSWKLGGAMAAVAATALFALDPTFLAHASIIKNDVAMSLGALGLAFATWWLGRRITFGSVFTFIFLIAAVLNIKFTGPLFVMASAVCLFVRAMAPTGWAMGARSIGSRLAKFGIVVWVLALSLAVGYTLTWALYGFRFVPQADGHRFDVDGVMRQIAANEIIVHNHPNVQKAEGSEIAAWKPGLMLRAVQYAEAHELLPQSYLYGFLCTYRSSRGRESYLLGETGILGSPMYFPVAFAVKEPLTTLGVIGLAIVVGLIALAKRRPAVDGPANVPGGGWAVMCIGVPVVIFAIATMASHVNIGVRHILPLYPFIFVAVGCGAGWVWNRSGGIWASGLYIILGALLLAETASVFPDYIAFFNRAAGGEVGGFKLLGDSNLDWGQDLPALAAWQRANPKEKLYLCYLGTNDPAYYGIKYEPLLGYTPWPWLVGKPRGPQPPSVLAVSASYLQGINLRPAYHKMYSQLRDMGKPIAILHGSIYLYAFGPR